MDENKRQPVHSDSEMKNNSDSVVNVLRGRRTISRFAKKPVSQELLFEAIETARWAPNHYLTEPWHFYVLGEKTVQHTVDFIYTFIAELKTEELARRKKRRAENVPAWVVVTSRRSDDPVEHRENYAATCCAIHNFSLFLWHHGVGLKWCTGPMIEEARCFDVFNVDQSNEEIVGVLRIGYPVNNPTQQRKSVAQITTVLP